MFRVLLVAMLLLSQHAPAVFAGGPLCYTSNGPLVWDTSQPIEYWIDKGPLRTARPPGDAGVLGAAAQQMVKDAFAVWGSIPTSNLKFKFAGTLADDVNTGPEFLDATENETTRNVVIFDQDGKILNDLYGAQQSESVLGFAAPLVDDGETEITRFVSLMNGKLVYSNAPQGFFSTLVHEFGHALGLDHSQIRSEWALDDDVANDQFVPIMYPTSTDADNAGQTRPLHADDVAWVSFLYPKQPLFDQTYGKIRGRVIRKNSGGTPFPGANVVARSSTDPDAHHFSCVSDYLKSSNGEFVIPVPPGSYKLTLVRIRPGFYEGSSVGPYADSKTDISFTQKPKSADHPQVINVAAGNNQPVTIEADLAP